MRTAGFSLIASAMLIVACSGGGSGKTTPTPPPEATASPTPPLAPSGDPSVTIENAIQACREKNADLLRAFVAVPVSDEEAEALFAQGDDVRLAVRQPAMIEGDVASVQVLLEVQRSSGIEDISRTWMLRRGADGVWRFPALPDCY